VAVEAHNAPNYTTEKGKKKPAANPALQMTSSSFTEIYL